MKLEIIGVGFDKFGEKFMQLEDDTRIYIDSAEYNSMKQKLSGKTKRYYDMDKKEVEELNGKN